MKRNILLTPGPITTDERVKEAQIVPDICPREEEFSLVMKSIRDDLRKIVNADDRYSSVLFSSSGTGAMESVVENMMLRESALVIINGEYGKRFYNMLSEKGIDCNVLWFSEEKGIDLSTVSMTLENQCFDYVFVTHHETTTGILNPINEIGELCVEFDCLYVIDAVSSFGGTEIDVNKCYADFIIGTSNKCLEGLPGLSFVICKKSSLNKTPSKSLYFDLFAQYQYLEDTGQMRFTAPVQSVYSFRKALDLFFEEGLENRIARYHRNNEVLVRGMKKFGFKKYLPDNVCKSKLLETFYYPENFNFKRFHDLLYEKGFTIYPGKLSNEDVFRLGNIGNITEKDIKKFLKEVKRIEK